MVPNESQAPKVSRRKGIDQIFRHDSLTLKDKLLGFAIWRRINRKSGSTFAYISTLARDVGIKRGVAQELLDHLAELGLFRTERRGDRTLITPLPLFDGNVPVTKAGGLDFERTMREWLDAVMVDLSLTDAQRVAAYAIASFIDPIDKTSWAAFRHLGDHVGLSEKTVRTAAKALLSRGWIKAVPSPHCAWIFSLAIPAKDSGLGNQVGNQVGNPKVDCPAISMASTGNRYNRLNLHSPTDSGAFAAQTRRADSASPIKGQQEPDLDSFENLIDLIEQFCDADEGAAIRIMDLVARANWNDHHHLTVDGDICPHFQSGLLVRVDKLGNANRGGQFFMITEAGHAARNRCIRQAA
jgi:hypothetical protein